MPKRKSTEIVVAAPSAAVVGAPDFSHILEADIPISQKRSMVLMGLGLKKPRKKYATKEERKAAAKERTKKRKGERRDLLAKYGLEPKKKGPKLSDAQKKVRRKERSKVKRSFLREMAKANPEVARKYGIDPTRFKL